MTPAQIFFWLMASLGNATALFTYLTFFNLPSLLLVLFMAAFTLTGLYDVFFSSHTLNRLYPVLAYLRYMMESIRPEIQQYFIATNTDERPFNREQRELVYRRAKNVNDTLPFGTQRDLMENNYLSIWHSMHPRTVKEQSKRILIGSSQCALPYSASLLNISAMSYGALSSHAIEALNLGAKLGGFAHNTGEGGVSPYHLKHGGDIIWQLGTGLFGCRTKDGGFDEDKFSNMANKPAIKMIEIKLSQGAKPGHGGVLPKAKISDEIAQIRGVSQDEDCVSPPMNPECPTPIALMEFVARLRKLSGGKPIGIKLCIGHPAEFLAICKAMVSTGILVDFITIDGAEGGTGAAPVEFSNRLGMMCLEGTFIAHQALIGVGLRDEIRIIASGKSASSFDILSKMAMGADTVNAARTMMMALGCIQSRSCNTNTCPTGIATQDPKRSKAIDIKAKSLRVKQFQHNTLHSLYELVGSMGLDDPAMLCPNMLKRRTSEGLLEAAPGIVPPLDANQLVDNHASGVWQRWWHLADQEQFYVLDNCTPKPQIAVVNL
ncbi:MAG: FMN-binding glutamate synthase family protein [Paraglaciecola sp.]|uniref:FMN-binding glutamate synthase family protein n=1 Tax=Paraglaciecola sp. TaxID=1920173 RepID=UPI00273F5A45|nr:FMN-binding glutamate synthase family protein [Paraglaciecola sp.]MDP5029797.1 FMN-binding glutamate synthase family protein [Paraglaciecola sp.]MDP5134187.1 FMN-binding glutamate synthase family protein [Paraglaciecola sp.]